MQLHLGNILYILNILNILLPVISFRFILKKWVTCLYIYIYLYINIYIYLIYVEIYPFPSRRFLRGRHACCRYHNFFSIFLKHFVCITTPQGSLFFFFASRYNLLRCFSLYSSLCSHCDSSSEPGVFDELLAFKIYLLIYFTFVARFSRAVILTPSTLVPFRYWLALLNQVYKKNQFLDDYFFLVKSSRFFF